MIRSVKVPVQPRNRIEALQLPVAVERRQRPHFNFRAHETIFERLKKLQLVLNHRAAERHARRDRAQSDETAITPPHTGEEILCRRFPAICRSEEHTSELQSPTNLVCR